MMPDIKEQLKRRAEELNISAVGVAPAEDYTSLYEILSKRGAVPFVPQSARERTDPFLVMTDAKSVVVYLCSYYTGETGEVSAYAMGRDYHLVLKRLGEALGAVIENAGYKTAAFCDNGPLNDRWLGYLAGLGFFGKNGFLIHPKWGSYTFIGYLVTDCPIPPDSPMTKSCMGCGRCIDACPGGALGEGFSYDSDRCASYIGQKKGELTDCEQDILKKSGAVWGCDRCQQVCPHNQQAVRTQIPEFSRELVREISDLTELTNRTFREKYGDRAFSWRGKSILERNQKIISGKDKTPE